jgi:hypothetical protein
MFVTELELVNRVRPEQVSQFNVDADQRDAVKDRITIRPGVGVVQLRVPVA